MAQDGPEDRAKLRSTVPLVVLPTSVSDRDGHPISGLEATDFTVLDNGETRAVRVDMPDSGTPPVHLIFAIQVSGMNSGAVTKLQRMGGLVTEAIMGSNSQVGVLTFDDRVTVVQELTANPDRIADSFRNLKLSDAGAARMLDAVSVAIDKLIANPGGKRASIVVIGQSRDRGSETKISELVSRLERSGVIVYGISYSSFLTAFTTKPEEYQVGGAGGGYLAALTETVRLANKNTMKILADATGGKQIGFETTGKLEGDLLQVGSDLHSRYLLSFTPRESKGLDFHRIQVRVTTRPDAIVRTRPGYWAASE